MGRSHQKYVPFSVTGSRLANLDDGTWTIPEKEKPMPEALTGIPPLEIRSAIFGFIRNEMSQATYHAFKFALREDSIAVTTNPKFTDHNGRAVLHLYGSCIHMQSPNRTMIVEYAEPDLFDQIERFINCWVL